MSDDAKAAVEVIHRRSGVERIEAAFVLGTGLGDTADILEAPIVIPYADLSGFPRSGVSGHEGRLAIGRLGNARVAFMQGRSHYYEHGNPRAMGSALETLALLGANSIVLTASAGSVNAGFPPGSLMLVSDHINFNGLNPLIGVESDHRFVPMTDAYDATLAERFRECGRHAGVALHEGVYMWFAGPSFETPAEIRMARMLGADAVGMSIVPEVILARHIGLRVAAIAMLTNFGAGFQGGDPSHAQTRDTAQIGALALRRLFRAFMNNSEDT